MRNIFLYILFPLGIFFYKIFITKNFIILMIIKICIYFVQILNILNIIIIFSRINCILIII